MKYSINVTEAKNQDGNVRGFANLVFGDSFKITNIAILENKEKGTLFVSMPRYKSNERDEQGGVVYKDVCNPITAEFREELYGNILEAFEQAKETIIKKWAGVTLHRVARQIKTELNGKKQNHTPWQRGMVAFTCNESLSDLVWTDCVEASRPVAGVAYTTVGNDAATVINGQNTAGIDEYILTSQYREKDPFKEVTSSQAMVVPIVNNVDQIYTLDSTTVAA